MDVNGYQREYRALCEELRKFVMSEVSSHGAGRLRSLDHRAMVTLYSLLVDHPIDPWVSLPVLPSARVGVRGPVAPLPGVQQGGPVPGAD